MAVRCAALRCQMAEDGRRRERRRRARAVRASAHVPRRVMFQGTAIAMYRNRKVHRNSPKSARPKIQRLACCLLATHHHNRFSAHSTQGTGQSKPGRGAYEWVESSFASCGFSTSCTAAAAEPRHRPRSVVGAGWLEGEAKGAQRYRCRPRSDSCQRVRRHQRQRQRHRAATHRGDAAHHER